MPIMRACRALLVVALTGPAAAAPSAGGAVDVTEADRVEVGETVVVHGRRHTGRLVDSTVATEVIDRAAIERSGAETAADVLARHSGVAVDRGVGGAGVSLLGLDPRYTLVLVDGQRTLGRINSTVDLDRIGVSGIERIEIIRGAASAAYGADGIAGVVNIITRRPAERFDARARVQGITDGGWRLEGDVGGGVGPIDLRVSGEYDDAPAFDLTPGDGSPATDGSASQAARARVRAAVRTSRRASVLAEVDYQLRALQAVDASPVAVFDRRKSTESGGGSIGANWADRSGGAGSARVRLDVLRDQYLLDQRGAAAEDALEDTRLLQVAVDARHSLLLGWHRLTVGVDGGVERADSPRLDAEGERLRGAIFVEDEWTLAPDPDGYLTVSAGVRADVSGDDNAISPRLATRFDPVEGLTLRGSVGLGFREADFTQRLLRFENPAVGYVVTGTPDLDPERAFTAQIGATWRVLEVLELFGEGAWAEIDDLIDIAEGETVGDRVFYRYGNIAAARTLNAESGVRLRLGAQRLGLGHRFTDAIDTTTGQPLVGRAAHQAHAELVLAHRATGLELDVHGLVVGARPVTAGESTEISHRADAFVDLSARVAWSPWPELTVFARGQNLLDAGVPVDNPLRPRRLTAGVVARL